MSDSYYGVVFTGINTNKNSFEHVGKEIMAQLARSCPTCRINIKTIYPYDDGISGDTISDTVQVVKNAYNICGNTVKQMADSIMEDFSKEDCIFFVGYSGGGVAATKTAEMLESKGFKHISKIIRVGSPSLTVGKDFCGRTVDITLSDDPIAMIEIPRFFKNIKPFCCFVHGLQKKGPSHFCYFNRSMVDDKGVSNLEKTVKKILSFVKN